MEKPYLSSLTLLGFELTSAIENGAGPLVSPNEAYQSIESGTLFQVLAEKLPRSDLSAGLSVGQREAVLRSLQVAADSVREGGSRKFPYVNSGLGFLLLATLQAIQSKDWAANP